MCEAYGDRQTLASISKGLPVEEGGEDEDTDDAEGQDVEDVGQEHLPLAVEPVLALLV